MKTKFYRLALLILGGAIFQNTILADENKLAAANDAFAFNLLRQIVKTESAQNIFLSPYSAAAALQMVANGAAGQTKTEMQRVLGTTDLSADEINAANKTISQSLNTGNTNVILTTANAIWVRKGYPIKPDFLAMNQEFFGATVDALDFSDPQCVKIINDWASERTHGRITQIADGIIDPRFTQLFLANAVYFKGKWADPFEVKATRDQPFYLRDGSRKNVPMMWKSKTFTYRRGTDYQAVRLPYEDENLAMYVFLPDTNSSPEKLLSLLNGRTWEKVTKPGFSRKEGTLELPRFKLEYSVTLNQTLQALGMKSAFDSDKADFSGIAPELYISTVLQKTFVEVKEEGTEAAAVTAVVMNDSLALLPQNPFEMIVNRPFLFLIEDSKTGTILFIGTVFDPTN
jgi:serpin B